MNEEKEQDNIQVVNKEQQDHEHSTKTQESVVDDGQDNIQALNEDKQEQDDIQVVNKEEHEEQEQDEGYSAITKKRRRFTLQEKLMYLQVIHRKVDKGFSQQKASKSINISHKHMLNWKSKL